MSDTRVGVWKSDANAVEMMSYYDDYSLLRSVKSCSRNCQSELKETR